MDIQGRGGGAGSKFHVKVIVAKEERVWKEIKANVESSENISCQTFTGSIKITKSDLKNAVQFIRLKIIPFSPGFPFHPGY